MMFKNILYYPDPEVGGGGEKGGGEKGGGRDGSGNGGIDYDKERIRIEGTEHEKDYTRNQEIYKRSFEDKLPKGEENWDKIIKIFRTSKRSKRIPTKGEKRQIIVEGTPTSIFTITATDSSDCSILTRKHDNVVMPAAGKYTFVQEFPSIMTENGAAKTKETYNFNIAPAADVLLSGINSGKPTFTLEQIADPIITITNTTSQTGPALSVSGSDVTITGRAFENTQRGSTTTYALTITGSNTETAESLYVKNADFNSNLTTNTIIKKVVDRCGETGITRELRLKPLTTRTDTTIEGEDTITGDLKKGMTMRGSVTHTKTLVANLDEDGEFLDYNKCKTLTDKFKLSDTNSLTTNMRVLGAAEATSIVSIDCDQNKITLYPKQIIKKDTVLTFTRSWDSTIVRVISNNDSEGRAHVGISRAVDIFDNTTVEFDDNKTLARGMTRFSGSGSDSITLTSYIKIFGFGGKNVTYTLDLDELITSKPNAYNKTVTTKKETALTINMIRGDFDANASSKTGAIVRSPQNGTMSSYRASTDDFIYTPANGFTGEDLFTYTMSDGVNTSDEKTVRITVK